MNIYIQCGELSSRMLRRDSTIYICSIVVVVVEYSSVLAACDECKAHVLIGGQAVARDSCEELAEVECCCSDVRASISIVVLVMLSPRHCDSTSSWYQFVAGLSA